ncbi:MAG: NAD(+) diphosphatase [Vulcanimicrobiaceae bacterium]
MTQAQLYRSTGFDRATERRDDAAWIEAQLAGNALLVPVWHDRSLVTRGGQPSAVLPPLAALAPFDAPIFLGVRDGSNEALFAADVDASDEAAALARVSVIADGARFADLREVGGELAPSEESLLSYARAIVHWQRETRRCAFCGAPVAPRSAGHVGGCTNASCGRSHFPRTDPATIVLVYDGDRALLGRKAEWGPQRYSTLAGFVEPGESLEDAVAREVREEAGVEVEDVRYFASQPWPFPQSLMLGFFAHAATTELHLGEELEDARWFTRDELRAKRERGELSLPSIDTIARRLIDSWVAGQAAKEHGGG